MLKPARMRKAVIIGLKANQSRVLSILHDLGAVQIEPISKHTASLVKTGAGVESLKRVSDELLRIRSLKGSLPSRAVSERRFFASLDELLAECERLEIDEPVRTAIREREDLQTKLFEIEKKVDIASKLAFLDVDLSVFSLKSASSFYGETGAQLYDRFASDVRTGVESCILYAYPAGDVTRFVAVVPNSSLEKFGSVLQKHSLKPEALPEFHGRPSEIAAGLERERIQIEDRLAAVRSTLESISDGYYALLTTLEEQLSIEARKLDVMNNLGYTENVFVIEGWVPQYRLADIRERLAKLTGTTTFVYAVDAEGEKPPTLMKNPDGTALFESFIRFYSVPQAEELDPTLIYAIVFPIFFGLMLGDVGYGVLILLLSAWIIRRTRRLGTPTAVPVFIRRFARTIFRPSAWGKLARAMLVGAFVSIVTGFLFNEYFGFGFNQYMFSYLNSHYGLSLPAGGALLDPTSTLGLKRLLLLSGYIGLFLVSFGLVLGALNSYWEREYRHIMGKVGWLLIALGISFLGLTLLHHKSVNPLTNPSAALDVAGVVAGIALVPVGEGANALIELPSIISHIISYTRLVGILLASVILAQVIDHIFLGTLGGGVAAALFGVVILVLGQLFNFVIGLFEPGVQGARLLYVEFFSKFFRGNGRIFRPFGGRRVYTIGELEREASTEQGLNTPVEAKS